MCPRRLDVFPILLLTNLHPAVRHLVSDGALLPSFSTAQFITPHPLENQELKMEKLEGTITYVVCCFSTGLFISGAAKYYADSGQVFPLFTILIHF